MNKLLQIAAVGEAAMGLALVVAPSIVGELLLGSELAGVSSVVAVVAGIAILALGIACWPGSQPPRAAACGMTTYSFLVALYLSYLGVRGEWVGPLLWPAAALHAVLTVLLILAWPRLERELGGLPSDDDRVKQTS